MRNATRVVAFVAALLVTVGLASPANGQVSERYVAAGDSIVMGAGAPVGYSWPSQLQIRCGSTCAVSNVGHGASCLVFTGCGHGETLLSSFDREVLVPGVTTALVSIGRNDLCHVSTDELMDGYKRLRGRARNVGVTVYFGTITPAGTGWPWPCELQRMEVNERLRDMPNVIDFERLVINRHGLLRWKYDSGDGLHLNAAGYSVLARAVDWRLAA